jgi:hypothetical protein
MERELTDRWTKTRLCIAQLSALAPAAETFSLSPEQAMIFAVKDSPVYLAGAFDLVAAKLVLIFGFLT